jgi:hypothetical protein
VGRLLSRPHSPVPVAATSATYYRSKPEPAMNGVAIHKIDSSAWDSEFFLALGGELSSRDLESILRMFDLSRFNNFTTISPDSLLDLSLEESVFLPASVALRPEIRGNIHARDKS